MSAVSDTVKEMVDVSINIFVELLNLHREAYEAEDVDTLKGLYTKLKEEHERWTKTQKRLGNRHATCPTGKSQLETVESSLLNQGTDGGFDVNNALREWISNLVKEDASTGWEFTRPEFTRGSEDERNKHLEKLRAVWSSPHFVNAVHYILAESSPQLVLTFLSGLCVRVSNRRLYPNDQYASVKWYKDYACPIRIEPGTFTPSIDIDHEGDHKDGVVGRAGAVWEDYAGDVPHRKLWWNPKRWFTQEKFMSEVAVFYSEAPIFGRCDRTGTLDFVNIHAGITLASDKYGAHYETPIAQGITANNWSLAYPQFIWQRSVDALFQLILSLYLAPKSHLAFKGEKSEHRPDWPSWWMLVAAVLMGTRGLCHILIEAGACITFGLGGQAKERQSILRSYLNPFTLFNLGAEIFSAWYVLRLASDYWNVPDGLGPQFPSIDLELQETKDMNETEWSDQWSGTMLREHPGELAVLIFLKWFQFMLSLMNFNILLPKLLPSWIAVTSGESIIFLFYLVLLSIGTTLSYYSFPNDLGWDMFASLTSLYRMFRLDFFADFDDAELEGLEGLKEGHTVDGSKVEDSSTHHAMQAFIIFYSLLFPVILLNMYVGVLSSVYENCLLHVTNVSGIYKSHVTSRLLIYRHFWRTLAGKCQCAAMCLSLDWWRSMSMFSANSDAAGEALKGTWILIPEDRLRNRNESSDQLDRVEKMLEENGKMLEKLLKGRST